MSRLATYPDGYEPGPEDIGKGAHTITIPAVIPESDQAAVAPDKSRRKTKPGATRKRKLQPLKRTQKFQYQSKEWRDYYGMRNLVESGFKLLKHHKTEDLANKGKRSGRGFAFHYLATSLAVVFSNIRRIIASFEHEAAAVDGGLRTRIRRRKDE